MGKLFEGVKIIEFCQALAGPLSAKVFSDYGATVIRVESITRPELFRVSPPFKDAVTGFNRGGRFNWANTGKLSVAVNLAHPKGIELAKRLVTWADVVLENFAGGTIQRMGLGYSELVKVKPDIIMLSTCMQGQTGPHATHPGFGMQLTALSGFDYISGWPDREPAELGAYTDFIAPYFNVLALLAALDYRDRTGKGQYIDMSQFENAVHYLAPLLLDYSVNQRVATRMGNRSEYAAPHGAYRCLGDDRWCVIAVFTDEEWQSFCQVIGAPSWSHDSRFATLSSRKENEDELDRLVEAWTIQQEAEVAMLQMQNHGVSAGVVQDARDLLDYDPQLKHRHSYWRLEHPEVREYRAPGPPFLLSKVSPEVGRAPLLGEHNEYVLKEILGMSDEQIAETVMEGSLE